MKKYIKQKIANSVNNQQIFIYINKISSKIPFRILDLVTRKLTTKYTIPLSLLPGIIAAKSLKYAMIPIILQ